MEEKKINTKKIIIFTVLITLLVEFVLGAILVVVVYFNYEKISKAKSGLSENIVKKEIKKVEINLDDNKNKKILSDSDFYEGKLGTIKTSNDSKENQFSESFTLDININEINKEVGIKALEKRNLLDKHLYNALSGSGNINDEVNNIISMHSLLKLITVEEGEKITNEINDKNEEIQKKLVIFIKTKNYGELSKYLKNLEQELEYQANSLPENIYADNTMLNNEDFQYIVSKLYGEDLYKIIREVSQNTGLDEKLIMSSVGVEQLRYMTTDRGYAKEMIKQNLPLTTFNKFSYGIGGIKFDTYQKINSDLKQYNPDMYQQYFQEYDMKSKIDQNGTLVYSDPKIQEVLEDDYSGMLYSAGLLYNIKKKRELAGQPIDNKIGVIITLYNMGNKKEAHSNPDVGGSRIYVDSDHTYYFGELGFIMYSYMKYYL